jgi:tetratricopeptide (TPR) repeat protein
MPQVDLSQKFPFMKPVKSPPPMMRINGCGLALYGKRGEDEMTGTYVATLCFSLLFAPILAVKAYRVARAMNGGWYFVGKEPLSVFARAWNTILLAAILTGALGIWHHAYTSSPAYIAQRKMEDARKQADAGQLGRAAVIYRQLALAGADQAENAQAALVDLLGTRLDQAALTEAAPVIEAAARVARGGRQSSLAPADVADRGLAVVTARGDSDPRAALAILDTVRPLVIDTRRVDDKRLPLLRKWAASEPKNLDAVVPLASILEQAGKLDEARKLLLPVKADLGDGEGARVLGQILAREDDYDGAYALLWPYVKSRLDTLHAAEKHSEDVAKQLWDREVRQLEAGHGPPDFFQRYKAGTEDQQRALVHEHMAGKMKADPDVAAARESLEQAARVVPVALELGIVMLHRGQAQADPAARKSQLEAAERVFLAIGGVAGETDEYRLSLGQVYYWLGRQAEGRKLFDEFLASKARSFEALMGTAFRLRQIGAESEARTMIEEAYDKASKNEERYQAAGFRAVLGKDSDDKIAWLSKADPASANVKAHLGMTRGDKALEEGRDDEAAGHYRNALDAYTAMQRTASSLNESALAHYGIFRATGDRAALGKCLDCFQQAVDLKPDDPVLLYNAGVTWLDGSIADVIGNALDLRVLREIGGVKMLGYLYRDDAGRAALARKVREHPGVARAVSYLEKVTVLSPRRAENCRSLCSLHSFTRNDDAMRRLADRVRKADIDTADTIAHTKEYLSGVKDAQTSATLAATLRRQEAVVTAARARGGATAAAAIGDLVAVMLALDNYTQTVDPDRIVALAREADTLSPSVATSATLLAAHCFRAGKQLRKADPAFDSLCNRHGRAAGVTYLVAVAASEPGPFQSAALHHPDVRRAIEIIREDGVRFPESHSPFEWALLKNADAVEAEKVATVIRALPRMTVEQDLTSMLHPASAGEALDTYWLMQIHGKPADARAALKKVADLGIPVPIQP